MKISFAPFFEDRSRWFLWWPVGLGIGISSYFSLAFEPPLVLVLFLFSLSLSGSICAFIYRRDYPISYVLSMILLSFNMGFTAAKVRTDWLSTPFLLTKIDNVQIKGRVVDIEEQPKRRRLTLDHPTFTEDIHPVHKVRLTMALSKPFPATIGDRIDVKVSLLPLSDPVSLEGYNFRRDAYFKGIGATGRLKGPIKIIDRENNWIWFSQMRHLLTTSIRQRIPGQNAEIATALITGDRSGISPTIRQAFTDAGLAHILAISGLHLTLVAGLIFLIFRRGLALFPYLAENYPIKKWSASLVILAAFAYLSVSGFGIPGQRAFVMICIVMIGILLDRSPLSMRLVAIAATLILLIRPESLLSASFQLSFAAVTALIAAYEGGWTALKNWSLEGGFHRRIITYGIGLMATTLIATLATTPYTLAIFNRITLQSIVGNVLAIPLTTTLIMPAATLSVLSLPFGGFSFAFDILSFGINKLIGIAEMVSAWPGAAILMSTPPLAFTVLITLGGLWICLWRNPWRWGGLLPCLLGCVTLFFQNPATIYAAGNGSVIAYRTKDTLYVSDLKQGQFFTDQWMKELGIKNRKVWTHDQVKIGSALLVRSPSFDDPQIFEVSEDMCHEKALITTGYAWRECREWGRLPKVLIDRYTLRRDGTYQIWMTSNGFEKKCVRKSLGQRPWNPARYSSFKNPSHLTYTPD